MTGLSELSKKKRTTILRRIAEEVRAHDSFLVGSHVNPEGDAIGSILALGLALEESGKKGAGSKPGPHARGSFLPSRGRGNHPSGPGRTCRSMWLWPWIAGTRSRLGEEFGKVKKIGKIINIDHHVSNRHFGDINLVDPTASSAAEILYDLLRYIPVKMTPAVAENIYTGILTDTGSFHYSNTSPKTFSVARACLLAGVDPWKVAEKVYETQPLARLRLLPWCWPPWR